MVNGILFVFGVLLAVLFSFRGSFTDRGRMREIMEFDVTFERFYIFLAGILIFWFSSVQLQIWEIATKQNILTEFNLWFIFLGYVLTVYPLLKLKIRILKNLAIKYADDDYFVSPLIR